MFFSAPPMLGTVSTIRLGEARSALRQIPASRK
jgi:hypothetical protein